MLRPPLRRRPARSKTFIGAASARLLLYMPIAIVSLR